jgi:hypothetical protein
MTIFLAVMSWLLAIIEHTFSGYLLRGPGSVQSILQSCQKLGLSLNLWFLPLPLLPHLHLVPIIKNLEGSLYQLVRRNLLRK